MFSTKNLKKENCVRRNMNKQLIKLADLKRLQVELQSQLDSIKINIQQLEKEVDEQNCPIMSRINEHVQNSSIKLNKSDLKEKRY